MKMGIDTKIKEVLSSILKGNFNYEEILPNESREEVKRVLTISENDGFLSHTSDRKPLLTLMGQKGLMLHPTAYITRSGEQFLEGYDRTKAQSQTTFNIKNVSNSALGDYNTVNNYSEKPLDDLVEFIKTLTETSDKEQGEKLINTLKNEEIKQGYLSKFDEFLSKYPTTVDLISSFVTSLAITKLT